jgi:hypothetical protein
MRGHDMHLEKEMQKKKVGRGMEKSIDINYLNVYI